MAKKKGRLGRLFGAITGSPYERLIKQVDKLVETSEDDRILGKNLIKLVKITGQNYEEEKKVKKSELIKMVRNKTQNNL